MSDDPLADEPFEWQAQQGGRVMVFHRGRLARTFKGREAARLLDRIEGADARGVQLALAKATGQFRFGNERSGRKRR